jgi:hypothetical protein
MFSTSDITILINPNSRFAFGHAIMKDEFPLTSLSLGHEPTETPFLPTPAFRRKR